MALPMRSSDPRDMGEIQARLAKALQKMEEQEPDMKTAYDELEMLKENAAFQFLCKQATEMAQSAAARATFCPPGSNEIGHYLRDAHGFARWPEFVNQVQDEMVMRFFEHGPEANYHLGSIRSLHSPGRGELFSARAEKSEMVRERAKNGLTVEQRLAAERI